MQLRSFTVIYSYLFLFYRQHAGPPPPQQHYPSNNSSAAPRQYNHPPSGGAMNYQYTPASPHPTHQGGPPPQTPQSPHKNPHFHGGSKLPPPTSGPHTPHGPQQYAQYPPSPPQKQQYYPPRYVFRV